MKLTRELDGAVTDGRLRHCVRTEADISRTAVRRRQQIEHASAHQVMTTNDHLALADAPAQSRRQLNSTTRYEGLSDWVKKSANQATFGSRWCPKIWLWCFQFFATFWATFWITAFHWDTYSFVGHNFQTNNLSKARKTRDSLNSSCSQVVQVYFPAMSAQFTLEMCAKVENCKKNTQTSYLGVQGHSRSSMLTPLKSSSLVLVLISRMSVSICNCFHANGPIAVK